LNTGPPDISYYLHIAELLFQFYFFSVGKIESIIDVASKDYLKFNFMTING